MGDEVDLLAEICDDPDDYGRAFAAGVAAGRRQAADAIRVALAEDLADSDVSSSEAIWEQAGYRDGLRTAADIAEEGTEGAPAEPVEETDR